MKNTALIRRRILSRRARVGVLGLGHVGLTLACLAADAGFPVTGIDPDRQRVDALGRADAAATAGLTDMVRSGIASERLAFTTDEGALSDSEIIVICVPTPPRNDLPDLSLLQAASRDVARHLGPSTLVVLESASYPGTTEQFLMPILQSSGLRAGRDFLLACAPDRVDPGNEEFPPRSIPKVVGGLTPEATGVAALFYNQMVEKVITVSTCRTAELSKLLEKTFRHVNIGLVNEMAVLCHEMGIDVWEVIDAASSKPFGFMPFHPGPGIGGHVVPLNPMYPAWQSAEEAPARDGILERAQQVNGQMPSYVASRIAQSLMEQGRGARGGTVLVLGVSYKPDIADIHESPSIKTIGHLKERGAVVCFHDPFVSEISLNGTVLHRTELTRRAVESADCVAILTPHRVYDLEWIAEHAQSVFDARNAFRDYRSPKVTRL